MAILTAYLQYDIDDFNLKTYMKNFDSHFLEQGVNNPWADNYSIFSGDYAFELLGSGFGYNGAAEMIKGNVEGVSEWFWDDIELAWTEIYNLTDAKEVSSRAFYDAFQTSTTSDDYALLETMLGGGDTFDLSANDDNARGYGGGDTMYGNDGNDVLKGDGGKDKLYGGRGDDNLKGNDGNDKLYGGDGKDRLAGGDGDDVLRGGKGRDKMIGGDGEDIFKFNTGDNKAIIKDFDAKGDAHDVIDLSGVTSITSWSDLTKNHMEKDGSDVRIDAGDGEFILIQNVNLSALDKAEFLF